jgi:hypothetical protein
MSRRDRSRYAFLWLTAVPAILTLGAGPRPSPVPYDLPKFDPIDRYETRVIEGWTVLVNEGLLRDQPDLAARTLTLLAHQLYQITLRVPAGPLKRLREIRIWVEEKESHHPCMAYHPDPGWLRDHDMNPAKARSVEIANARNFLDWTRDQPWMVLHELAHGYHHRALPGGFANGGLKSAYTRAKASGRYESVLRIGGREERAYAMTDPMEYFAEATEAYFGINDFYPFVRAELKRHDPELFDLLGKLWEGPSR